MDKDGQVIGTIHLYARFIGLHIIIYIKEDRQYYLIIMYYLEEYFVILKVFIIFAASIT